MHLSVPGDALGTPDEAGAERWRQSFWQTPIPAQGEAPPAFARPARGLGAGDCALCHYDKFEAWRGSRHARAMGPGVTGQLPGMDDAGRATCLECHAPMSEQWARLADGKGDWRDNPAFDPALRAQGITCAACHLRAHRRHGPPRPEAPTAPDGRPASALLHGAPVRSEHFRAAAFCKGCHQHPPGSVAPGGKPVENSYAEWRASPSAAAGVTCQDCHLPEGAHGFRGIHDRDMTRSGVTITTRVTPEAPAPGERVAAELTLRNTGTGHAFPTYTTPAVFLKTAFLDADGDVLPRDADPGNGDAGSHYAEKILQRRLDMSTWPWGEQSDTRLAPGDSATLRFARRAPPGAHSLYLWVWVAPDHFYTGFFRDVLARSGDGRGTARLRKALQDTLESRYLLFSRTVPIVRAD